MFAREYRRVRTDAARKIQREYRGYRVRVVFYWIRLKNAAATAIQAAFRGFRTRDRLQGLLAGVVFSPGSKVDQRGLYWREAQGVFEKQADRRQADRRKRDAAARTLLRADATTAAAGPNVNTA